MPRHAFWHADAHRLKHLAPADFPAHTQVVDVHCDWRSWKVPGKSAPIPDAPALLAALPVASA